ncbi:MAG TPA: dimethylmenaquinone methyltransferase [Dehalococcoidia bacterium]|nr:dimethylmenaquinone methyltransferase [Dehalococcoidia bacterium]
MVMKVNTQIKRPAQELVEGFRALLKYNSPACAVADAMGGFNAMTSDIKPIIDGIRLVGVAITAKTMAADVAPVIKAVDIAQPGDIVVVDARSSRDTAFFGENLSISCRNRGVQAIIIDGATRDIEELRESRFPVLCRAVVPNAGSTSGYGRVNVPIQCGGVEVNPGDIILVDLNGVVVVHQEEAEAVLKRATQILETEHVLQDKLRAGATVGELLNIDEIMSSAFAYQERATGRKGS